MNDVNQTICVPIYRAWFTLSVTNDVVAARKAKSDVFGPYLLGEAKALASCNDKGDFGLFFSFEDLTHGIIAHEIFHLTHRIMDDVRGKFDIDNQEPHAYLCEWLTTWVYFQLQEHGITLI